MLHAAALNQPLSGAAGKILHLCAGSGAGGGSAPGPGAVPPPSAGSARPQDDGGDGCIPASSRACQGERVLLEVAQGRRAGCVPCVVPCVPRPLPRMLVPALEPGVTLHTLLCGASAV